MAVNIGAEGIAETPSGLFNDLEVSACLVDSDRLSLLTPVGGRGGSSPRVGRSPLGLGEIQVA